MPVTAVKPLWDDLLPDYPAEIAEADALPVATTLPAKFGGWLADG